MSAAILNIPSSLSPPKANQVKSWSLSNGQKMHKLLDIDCIFHAMPKGLEAAAKLSTRLIICSYQLQKDCS